MAGRRGRGCVGGKDRTIEKTQVGRVRVNDVEFLPGCLGDGRRGQNQLVERRLEERKTQAGRRQERVEGAAISQIERNTAEARHVQRDVRGTEESRRTEEHKSELKSLMST